MTNIDKTNSVRGRGRPGVPEAKRKHARNLTVSNSAWQGLEDRIKVLQIKTVSELVEQIGLAQIRLTPQDASSLADIPIYRRLKSLISEPVAIFWSILAFAKRTCHQLGFQPSDDQIQTIILKAFTITFYVGYTHPDILINNASALLRWLCFRVTQADAENVGNGKYNEVSVKPIDPVEVEELICRIGNALNALETAARSADYEALKMKTIDGLTIKQISRIFKLQGLDVSKADVSIMIKKGLASFRQLFYIDSGNCEPRVGTITSDRQDARQIARSYIELALQTTLWSANSQEVMADILLKTSHDPYLDFWLNEIDYDLGGQNDSLRRLVADQLETHLLGKKKEIDRELAFCHTRDQIRQTLQTYASREAGIELSIQLLLSENC
jgi:hypothetical protein